MSNTNTRKVTLVSRWDHDGTIHQGGDTITVPAPLARDLTLIGKARYADEPTAAPALAAETANQDRDTDTTGDASAPAEKPEAPADGDIDKAPAARRAARK